MVAVESIRDLLNHCPTRHCGWGRATRTLHQTMRAQGPGCFRQRLAIARGPQTEVHLRAMDHRAGVGVVGHVLERHRCPEYVAGELLFYSPTKKPGPLSRPGFSLEDGLAVTYFRVRNAHYHRRKPVSRSCSGWEGVGPGCCGRQIED